MAKDMEVKEIKEEPEEQKRTTYQVGDLSIYQAEVLRRLDALIVGTEQLLEALKVKKK